MNSLDGLEPANPAGILLFGKTIWRGGGMDIGMEGFLGIGRQIEKVIIKGENYNQIVSQADPGEILLVSATGISIIEYPNSRYPEPEIKFLIYQQATDVVVRYTGHHRSCRA